METSGQTESAVIDRFERRIAVLRVKTNQRIVNVPRDRLPSGVQAGQWMRVQFDGDVLLHAELDGDATEAARQRIQDKLSRLRRGDHLH
jgi:hypothetical protein